MLLPLPVTEKCVPINTLWQIIPSNTVFLQMSLVIKMSSLSKSSKIFAGLFSYSFLSKLISD